MQVSIDAARRIEESFLSSYIDERDIFPMFRVVAVFRLVRLMRSMPEVRGAGSLIIFGLFDSFPHCVHTPGNDTTVQAADAKC